MRLIKALCGGSLQMRLTAMTSSPSGSRDSACADAETSASGSSTAADKEISTQPDSRLTPSRNWQADDEKVVFMFQTSDLFPDATPQTAFLPGSSTESRPGYHKTSHDQFRGRDFHRFLEAVIGDLPAEATPPYSPPRLLPGRLEIRPSRASYPRRRRVCHTRRRKAVSENFRCPRGVSPGFPFYQ